jgi:hypothetical protein
MPKLPESMEIIVSREAKPEKRIQGESEISIQIPIYLED